MIRGIVTLGAGTGQSATLSALAGLGEVTAIVGVTDDGGHSGSLRRTLGIPQVGDLRNCLSSLAPADNPIGKLLRHRFKDGVATGNLMLAALVMELGSLTRAAEAMRLSAGVEARILPVSDGSAKVCGKLADGKTVRGEWGIIGRRNLSPVKRVFHDPVLKATPEAIDALRHAKAVIICPGSLWTGIGSVLAVKGIRAALAGRRVIYVMNIMTQAGQTDLMDAPGHVAAVASMIGRPPDDVLVNTGPLPRQLLRIYARHGSAPVDMPSPLPTNWTPAHLTENPTAEDLQRYRRTGKFKGWPHFVRHDRKRLREALGRLI